MELEELARPRPPRRSGATRRVPDGEDVSEEAEVGKEEMAEALPEEPKKQDELHEPHDGDYWAKFVERPMSLLRILKEEISHTSAPPPLRPDLAAERREGYAIAAQAALTALTRVAHSAYKERGLQKRIAKIGDRSDSRRPSYKSLFSEGVSGRAAVPAAEAPAPSAAPAPIRQPTDEDGGDVDLVVFELDLVVALCLPVLEDAIDKLRTALEDNPQVDLPSLVPPFCRALLESRTAVEGWTLLMLAAGAGCVELVDALLTLGELQVMDVARPSIRGETALHSAAASHNFETCKMLVERTNLQLKGAFAENIDGQTPLDVCQEPFHSKLIALTKEHTFTAFLSHYKMETAAHARILKDHLEQSFGRGRVFLDSDDLRNLSELLHCVAASDVMVVLLSPGVLTRPWCLMELITAMERGKPIVPISCENLPQGMYDHKEMKSFLSSLEANLNACNPGATDLLRQNGVENMDVSGQALLPYIHEPIAKPFRVDWSANMMEAAMKDILEAIEKAKPPTVASAKLRSVKVLSKWVADKRGSISRAPSSSSDTGSSPTGKFKDRVGRALSAMVEAEEAHTMAGASRRNRKMSVMVRKGVVPAGR